jgi:hypothetical protein
VAAPIIAPMPDLLDLAGPFTFTWTALDPVTGDPVDGVVIDEATIYGQNLRSLKPTLPPNSAPLLAHDGNA